MKLKEFMGHLADIYNKHGNLDVIFSIEDNGYHFLDYAPVAGYLSETHFGCFNDDPDEDEEVNTVCIN